MNLNFIDMVFTRRASLAYNFEAIAASLRQALIQEVQAAAKTRSEVPTPAAIEAAVTSELAKFGPDLIFTYVYPDGTPVDLPGDYDHVYLSIDLNTCFNPTIQ